MSNPAPVLTVIQPDMAAAWLEQNTNNRSINNTRVKRYAADMAEGNWAVTGDSIRFSKSGKLLDGQHRLWACVESAAPFTAYVLKGLPEDSQLYMDQGMPRSKGSQLSKEEEEEALRIFNEAGTKTGVKVKSKLVVGEVVESILGAADAENADLIVMGATGERELKKWIKGNVLIEVMERATVPVTIIPSALRPDLYA